MTETTQFVKHGLSVQFESVAYWSAAEGAALLEPLDVAAVASAVQGIKAIAAILYQREVDLEGASNSEGEAALKLGAITTTGLLAAMDSCAELVSCKLAKGSQMQRLQMEAERPAPGRKGRGDDGA